MICKSKTLFLVALATLFISLTGVLATTGNSAAQTAQPSTAAPPPPEKVQELIKLLDDPDVRAWLTTKSQPASEEPEAAVASQISGWEQAIRNRLISMRNALPLIPRQAANAASRVELEVNIPRVRGHSLGLCDLVGIRLRSGMAVQTGNTPRERAQH